MASKQVISWQFVNRTLEQGESLEELPSFIIYRLVLHLVVKFDSNTEFSYNYNMHIEFIFFTIYIIACFYAFPLLGFIKRAHLSALQVRLLLGLKLLVALACAFYFLNFSQFSDSLAYNEAGKSVSPLLRSDPVLFFTSTGANSSNSALSGLFESSYSLWADLRFSLLYKLVAIFNLLTAGNFYLNSVVFSSIVFFGHIAFYRIYKDLYPGHTIKLLVACFLLPSVLMYTACVHKDGLSFFFVGLLSFIFYSFLKKDGGFRIKYLLPFLVSLLGIFIFRNYVLLALLPAMLTAWLCKTLPYHKKVVVVFSYAFYAVVFFLSKYIHPSLNLPAALIKRKLDFVAAGDGNTTLPMGELNPNAGSFLQNLPQALNHTLLRPYLWEFPGFGVLLTALELFFYQLIFVAFLFCRNKKESMLNNYNIYGFAFFLTMVLIIGYTIPNVGAIVRYRSLLWIFVLCPMVCCIDWSSLAFWQRKSASLSKS